jgi:hypothetical protein
VYRDIQKILEQMVEITGGLAYYPESKGELGNAAERIAVEMRHQYRLTFPLVTAGPTAKKPHHIKLEVTTPSNVPNKLRKLRVRTRRDFYAP